MSISPNETPEPYVPAYNDIVTTSLTTHTGQRLSPKEDRFITLYIKYSDPVQAAREAGYSVRETLKNKDAAWGKRGNELLSKGYIKDEIAFRMEQFRDSQIADTKEALMYLTRVMRGEEKDQFGLDVSAADRMSAAKEIIKRNQELEQAAGTAGVKEVRLVLRRE